MWKAIRAGLVKFHNSVLFFILLWNRRAANKKSSTKTIDIDRFCGKSGFVNSLTYSEGGNKTEKLTKIGRKDLLASVSVSVQSRM